MSTQEEPNVIVAGLRNKKIILLPLLTLFLGIVIGLVSSRLIPLQQIAKPQSQTNLPISLELLQNPAVYEWRGSVTGKIIAKDEHTLTLEDDKGNKITLTDLLPQGAGTFKTIYFKKTDTRPIQLTLKDIPLGTTLRGEFFVFRNFSDTPVASSFTIVE